MRTHLFGKIVLLVMLASDVYAHDAGNHVFNVADPNFAITSDFGPRATTGSAFHKAIDFQRAAGDSLPLLADGVITDLARGATGQILWITVNITQAGITHRYRYMHLFDNSDTTDTATTPLICSGGAGGYVLAKHSGGALAIVKLSAGSRTHADYILARAPGNTVTVNFNTTVRASCAGFTGIVTFDEQDVDASGNPLFDATGAPVYVPVETEDTVTVAGHPSVGPAGTSGDPPGAATSYPAHMHIEMAPGTAGFGGSAYSENPLFHMPDRVTEYKVQVLDKKSFGRLEGFVVGPASADSSFLRVEVDSRVTSGTPPPLPALDLEEVNFYIDVNADANRIRQFKMGGNTEPDDRINISDGEIDTALVEQNINGVRPVRESAAPYEGIAGLERYVYTDWEAAGSTVSPTNLSEGLHTLIIKLTDIHTNEVIKNIQFNVDKTPPSSSLTVKTTP